MEPPKVAGGWTHDTIISFSSFLYLSLSLPPNLNVVIFILHDSQYTVLAIVSGKGRVHGMYGCTLYGKGRHTTDAVGKR